jgi:hypothetical protein
MAAPFNAVGARVGGKAPLYIHEVQLAVIAALIACNQPAQCFIGRNPASHQIETIGTEAFVHESLRRNGAGACPDGKDAGTNSEEPRGNRDANAPRAAVMRNNRPSHAASLRLSRSSWRNIVAKKSAFPHWHFSCQKEGAAGSIIDRGIWLNGLLQNGTNHRQTSAKTQQLILMGDARINGFDTFRIFFHL